MNESAQTSKRVVSKGEYYFHRGVLVFTRAQGLVMLLAGTIGVPYLFVCWHQILLRHLGYTVFMVLACSISTLGGFVLINRAGKAEKEMNLSPLTRANTVDLPAPESLVRASAEPVQQQEAVLLRAAAQSEERHEEQLLRPAE